MEALPLDTFINPRLSDGSFCDKLGVAAELDIGLFEKIWPEEGMRFFALGWYLATEPWINHPILARNDSYPVTYMPCWSPT